VAARPTVVNQSHLAQMSFNAAEIMALYGSTAFTQMRMNETDISLAYTSSPELQQLLRSQNAAGRYDAWSASAQCTICAVQSPVLYFPNDSAATQAFERIRQINQTIFQNVQQQPSVGPYWDQSLCQIGQFTTMAGQTLTWHFCAMRKANAIKTTSIGGFNLNAMQLNEAVGGHASRVEAYLKTQFP
jgi:hypothetical protein